MNWNVYRFHDNWHKHPWISPILCWLGRHDYELEETHDFWSATLYCVCCDKKKHSTNVSSALDASDS